MKKSFLAFSLFVLLSTVSAETRPGADHVSKYFLYVGTYTVRGSRGIYAFDFDAETGALRPMGLVAEGVNPSFLLADSSHSVLYAVSEIGDYKGKDSGAIQAYRIDRHTGKLLLLNGVSSGGAGPCFLSSDRLNNHLFVANFHGGSIAAFPLLPEGRIGSASTVIQHHGSSVHPTRQNKPHPHSVELTPDEKFLVAADLGLDKVFIYRFDAATGSIAPAQPPDVKVHDGAGPRHFVFDPQARHLYVINEIDSTVSVFAFGQQTGVLSPLQTISSLPTSFSGHNDAAEIRISANGRFVSASNRGADTITQFAVDPVRGTLTLVGSYPSGGKTPVTFQFAPGGRFLLAANQGSDAISVFHVDPATGALSATDHGARVAAPSSLVFVPAGK